MSYIILYNEKYGYLERFKKWISVYTHDFHFACNYNWLDKAMRVREFLNARYDGERHIEVFTMEG